MTLRTLSQSIPDSIIILADHFRFPPGGRRGAPCVASRRLLLCRSGRGTVTVNGEQFVLTTGKFILMPWHHEIASLADHRSPFVVCSIHLVPYHPRIPVVYSVPHDDRQNCRFPQRSDISLDGLERPVAGDLVYNAALGPLAEYIVSVFRRGPEENVLRTLAPLLVHETLLALRAGSVPMPLPLAAAVKYLEKQDSRVSLAELSRVSRVSGSTVIRLFREHFSTTPGRYVLERKIAQAKELLLGTEMTVESVGESVGIPNPFYFSRLFKKITGKSPRQCRTDNQFI